MNDAAPALGHHAGQKRLVELKCRAAINGKGKVPIGIGAGQRVACVHMTGAVKQHVSGTHLCGVGGNGLVAQHIKHIHTNIGVRLRQRGQGVAVDVAGVHGGAGLGKGQCRGPTNALARGGDHGTALR